jgi:hypothetical protein
MKFSEIANRLTGKRALHITEEKEVVTYRPKGRGARYTLK